MQQDKDGLRAERFSETDYRQGGADGDSTQVPIDGWHGIGQRSISAGAKSNSGGDVVGKVVR
jgi:hypothetical protein